MGHQRRFDVGGMSAIAPIATKMLRRDERRKGPIGDIPRRANVTFCALFLLCGSPPSVRREAQPVRDCTKGRDAVRDGEKRKCAACA